MDNNVPDQPIVPPAPPPPPPPPIIPPRFASPGATPPRRTGRGWMVAALILMALLAVSLLANLGSVAGSMLGGDYGSTETGGPKLQEVVVEQNNSANKIVVIEVSGVITSEPIQGAYSIVEVVKAQLNRASRDKRVQAVVLKVDSPGGEVLASDEIYRLIADFQEESGKSVVASMGSLAASGGYYISAPCRWIVANELTITGSIGVIMQSYNYRGLMDKVGLQPQTYKSGRFKDMMSGSRKPESITDEEVQMVQGLIDEVYGKFRDVVAEGRTQAHKINGDSGRALSADWKEYADGRILSGSEAYRVGLVDELGSFQDAVSRASNLAGIEDANLITYHQILDFADIFRLFGKSQAESATVKLDIGLDVPRLKAGQPYYLSPTYLH